VYGNRICLLSCVSDVAIWIRLLEVSFKQLTATRRVTSSANGETSIPTVSYEAASDYAVPKFGMLDMSLLQPHGGCTMGVHSLFGEYIPNALPCLGGMLLWPL
jgi:hypothetical protein